MGEELERRHRSFAIFHQKKSGVDEIRRDVERSPSLSLLFFRARRSEIEIGNRKVFTLYIPVCDGAAGGTGRCLERKIPTK